MKHKGIELKEITEPQVFDPPKKMLVCNNEESQIIGERMVAAILPKNTTKLNETVIAISTVDNEMIFTYKRCFEIPEALKSRRATIRELAKWCAQGNGQIQDTSRLNCVFTGLDYGPDCDDHAAPEIYKVRKWEDDDWHEPTAKYLGLEG